MAFYKLYQNKNENMPKCYQKWYAHSVVTETVDLDYIAERIQRNCTAKKSDAKVVLTEMVEVIADCLKNSQRVKIDGFGAFKLGISSRGADTVKNFSVTENIRGVRIIFQPEISVDASTHKRTKKMLQGIRFADSSSLASSEAIAAAGTDDGQNP
ncbi:MAG: HU family DNA-binding protein [Prevotella sp.]|nr:HU family DNA-binding protein [Prevotella sp.]